MAYTVLEIVWIANLIRELRIENKGPVYLFCDSKPVLQIAMNLVFHERMKHIEFDCHVINFLAVMFIKHMLCVFSILSLC